MVRAAAKNHASVAIVTSPARYEAVLAALDDHGTFPLGLRSPWPCGVPPHRGLTQMAAELPDRNPACPLGRPIPAVFTISMEKVDTLPRYGGPRPGRAPANRVPPTAPSPAASRRSGEALSYNNVLDAAAAALARLMRVLQSSSASTPTRVRGAPEPARGLGGGAGWRPGLGVRGRGRGHRDRGPGAGRKRHTGHQHDRRDRRIAAPAPSGPRAAARSLGHLPRHPPRQPSWTWPRHASPTDAEFLPGHGHSPGASQTSSRNAILLVRDGMLVGTGQVNQVDACRGAWTRHASSRARMGRPGPFPRQTHSSRGRSEGAPDAT